jgi:hypothetical protein
LNKVASLNHRDAKRTVTLLNRDCVALSQLATPGRRFPAIQGRTVERSLWAQSRHMLIRQNRPVLRTRFES